MSYSIKDFFRDFKMFFEGASDFNRKSSSILKKEAHNEMDNFILLCFGDQLGIPLPTSYYALEILPYIADDLEGWSRRMMDRKSIWGERWGDFDLDA
ncbi:MAG: hypothetical protein ACERKV_13705 [Clostridiaceae bacterium]